MIDRDVILRAIETLRDINAVLEARGRPPITTETLRTGNPGWFGAMEAIAPGMVKAVAEAVAGDRDAVTRLEAILATEPPPLGRRVH